MPGQRKNRSQRERRKQGNKELAQRRARRDAGAAAGRPEQSEQGVAAARPASSAFGEDAFPTLPEKAAVLLHAIARNHPFADGNKRTAWVVARLFLALNGKKLTFDKWQNLT